MPIEEFDLDLNVLIVQYVEDPVPMAGVNRAWAWAVSELGRAFLPELYLYHPKNPTVLQSYNSYSHQRVIYYMSIGRVAPHPGNFTAPLDATHPIWPFPVPRCWRDVLRRGYKKFPTPVDRGVCVKAFQLPSGNDRPGPITYAGNKPVSEADGNLSHTDRQQAKIIAGMSRLWPVPRDNVFSVGPLYVAIPNAFTDLAGPPVAVNAHAQPHHDGLTWNEGVSSGFELSDHVLWLRRASPSCVAIMASKPDEFAYAYVAGVVSWTKISGLRVRQYGRPASPDHKGWALPPLDVNQYEQPVFVFKWGAEEPIYPKPEMPMPTEAAEGAPPAKRARLEWDP